MDQTALLNLPVFLFENIQYVLILVLLFVGIIYYRSHPKLKFFDNLIPKKWSFPDPFLKIDSDAAENQIHHHTFHPEKTTSLSSTNQNTQAGVNNQEVLEKYEKGLEEDLKTLFVQSEKEFTGQTTLLKEETAKYEAQFKKFLDELEAQAQAQANQMQEQLVRSQETFTRYLNDLSIKTQKYQLENQEQSQKRIEQVFKGIEDKISDYLIQNEQKMMMSIDLELRSARQLIDTYKVQQLSIIDENIVAMLERTISLVLSKKLNIRDQMDLVYEALEKAKIEKFIV